MPRSYPRFADLGLLAIAFVGITFNSMTLASQLVDFGAEITKPAEATCGDGNCGDGVMLAKAIAAIKTARGKDDGNTCADSRKRFDASHAGCAALRSGLVVLQQLRDYEAVASKLPRKQTG